MASSNAHKNIVREQFDRYFCMPYRVGNLPKPSPQLSKIYKYISFIPLEELNGYPAYSLIRGQIKPAIIRYLDKEMAKHGFSLSVSQEEVELYRSYAKKDLEMGRHYLQQLEDNLALIDAFSQKGKILEALLLVPANKNGKYLTPDQKLKVKLGRLLW